ncbi:hypothetical protein Tco_0134498 [Tanacetum coccineum]
MEECHKMLTNQVDWTNPEGDQVRIDVNRPLPLGGPLDEVMLSLSCFGLELLMPEQMWIDEVCTYDISVVYGISHWWFNRQKFYIERHDSLSCQREVKNHMRIPSVVSIKAYSRYGCQTMDPKLGNSTTGKDFQLRIKSYQKQLNLTKPGWDAKGYEFKHDYTIIKSPRAVVFPVNHNERKIIRFHEIYKFSDGMLTRILEALDYRVKEFKIKRLNQGMNTRFWTQKDVTRSKEFISAIEMRLKTRRIYQNLECFVGGRDRDVDYRLLQRTK